MVCFKASNDNVYGRRLCRSIFEITIFIADAKRINNEISNIASLPVSIGSNDVAIVQPENSLAIKSSTILDQNAKLGRYGY